MSENIRDCGPEDIPGLRTLWKTAFGDSDRYIDGFFDHLFCSERTVKAEIDGKIVSAVYILYMGEMDSLPAYEIYALATLPEYRSRGIAGRVLRYAAEKADSGAVCICPAESSLINYYEKTCGYVPFFYAEEFRGEAHRGDKIRRVDPGEYTAVREKLLSGRVHIAHSQNILDYQEFLCGCAGGGLYVSETEGEICCAAVEVYRETAVIKELLASPENRKAAAAGFAFQAGAERYMARTPAQNGNSGRVFAMVLPDTVRGRTVQPPWFGFAFD